MTIEICVGIICGAIVIGLVAVLIPYSVSKACSVIQESIFE